MKALLRFEEAPGETKSFELGQPEVVIGRDDGATLPLRRSGVSRRHARIVFDGKSYFVEDLQSTNGTFVNGKPAKRQKLQHLYVITLGREADLVFLLGGAVETANKPGIVGASLFGMSGVEAARHEISRGEITLGRSVSCNVVVDNDAVSKLHAKIERTPQVLILRDLRSSNGTFVNGARVGVTPLHDGDRVSLAKVVEFRVDIENGLVPTSGRMEAPDLGQQPDDERQPQHWKTRLDWGSGELRGLADLQRKLAEADQRRAARAERGAERGKTKGVPAKRTAPIPAPAAAAPAVPKPAPPAPAPAPVAEAVPPIREVRLTGPEIELVVTEPGRYEMGRSAALRVAHPTVSRRHACLTLSADRRALSVEDMGAAHATRRNGAPLQGSQPLADGDTLTLGALTLAVAVKRG